MYKTIFIAAVTIICLVAQGAKAQTKKADSTHTKGNIRVFNTTTFLLKENFLRQKRFTTYPLNKNSFMITPARKPFFDPTNTSDNPYTQQKKYEGIATYLLSFFLQSKENSSHNYIRNKK